MVELNEFKKAADQDIHQAAGRENLVSRMQAIILVAARSWREQILRSQTNETYVPTQHAPPKEDPWIQDPDEDPRRESDLGSKAFQGQDTPQPLTRTGAVEAYKHQAAVQDPRDPSQRAVECHSKSCLQSTARF